MTTTQETQGLSKIGEVIYGASVDQQKVDWTQKPPMLTGFFDGKPWRACFLFNESWEVFRAGRFPIPSDILESIGLFLDVAAFPPKSEPKQEIERKFVLEKRPAVIEGLKGITIKQGYIPVGSGEFRLRQKDEQYFMTAKTKGGISREEWEIEVPFWVFAMLWINTQEGRIEKTRYEVTYEGHTLEIDVFEDELEGHFLLECEFESLEEAQAFQLPEWAQGAKDVTDDPDYKNLSLAFRGWPEA